MSTCLEPIHEDVSETERKHSDSSGFVTGGMWGGGFEVTSCYYGSQGPFLVALIKELKS